MENRLIFNYIDKLSERYLSGGGFAVKPGGGYRPDSTAWAILAFSAVGTKKEHVELSQIRLVTSQLDDGRISVSPEYPDAYWPTALTILAWQNSHAQIETQLRAIKFLINNTGKHWPRKPDASVAHDTNIRGWPWIANTHSWVEPTALSLIALQMAGYGEHERAQEATRMLMDRQLIHGGWNFGNTIVFDQELYPMPENTGMALNALAGRVKEESVRRSLNYLEFKVKNLRTPLSLGWSLLGLGAWGKRPDNAKDRVLESLELQKRYGNYSTQLLSLLIISYFTTGGINSIFT